MDTWRIAFSPFPLYGVLFFNVYCMYILIYTTFTPHFKGKRRCISGIIALLSALRNASTRNGDSIYKLYPF